jgi:hypothetical protein
MFSFVKSHSLPVRAVAIAHSGPMWRFVRAR